METADVRRSRRRIWLGGILGLIILMLLCLWVHGKRIPPDITGRVSASLAAKGWDSSNLLAVEGRDVILRGEIDDSADRASLVQTARAVRGVRTVTDQLVARTSAKEHLEKAKTDLALQKIQFNLGSADLTEAGKRVLDDLATRLQQAPKLELEVAAHTDSTGMPSYNLDLSNRRAETVVQYLVSKGIAADRLIPRGYGASRPVADNATHEGRAKNRRIEFQLIEKGR
jgi:OOP family OmpA-OmpF porin